MGEDRVAAGVPVGVVDLLEVVDVEESEREGAAVPAGADQLLLQAHLEVLVVVAARQAVADGHLAQRREAGQVRADPRHQLRRVERLGQVVVAAHLQAAHALLDVAAAGDEDDRHELQRRIGAHAAAHLESVHLAEEHVEDDEVRALAQDRLVRVGGIAAAGGEEPGRAQHGFGRARGHQVVVDDQHPGRHVLEGHARPARLLLQDGDEDAQGRGAGLEHVVQAGQALGEDARGELRESAFALELLVRRQLAGARQAGEHAVAHGPGAAREPVEEVAQLAHRGGVAGLAPRPDQGFAGTRPRLVHLAKEHDLEVARIEEIGHSC